jgi:hypothetical protein
VLPLTIIVDLDLDLDLDLDGTFAVAVAATVCGSSIGCENGGPSGMKIERDALLLRIVSAH